MRSLLAAACVISASCAIPEDDLLPGIGAPCSVDAALCPIEHTCTPSKPGEATGLCEPVLDFGRCEKPTWPPGRIGDVEKGDVTVDEPADRAKMDGIRVVNGLVTVRGSGDVGGQLELQEGGGLCNFRGLQRVGDGLIIARTDLKDLDGLQSLTSVVNGIAIVLNNELESLAGLEKLVDLTACERDGNSVQVLIARNALLRESVILDFAEQLEERLGAAPELIHCENGPAGDADEGCGELAFLVDILNGEPLCQ